uniref:Uncharacterized protein n=1 Tax=Timema genevievae TaxID=629358 RepID=A0A7R9JQA2_TIMGE|nr:unnamed protein product [Timema genevievae]
MDVFMSIQYNLEITVTNFMASSMTCVSSTVCSDSGPSLGSSTCGVIPHLCWIISNACSCSSRHLTGLGFGIFNNIAIQGLVGTPPRSQTPMNNLPPCSTYHCVSYTVCTRLVAQLGCLGNTAKQPNARSHVGLFGSIMHRSCGEIEPFTEGFVYIDNMEVITMQYLPGESKHSNMPPHVSGWKCHGKTTPDRDSNLNLPIIRSLIYCESCALDHATTQAVNAPVKKK